MKNFVIPLSIMCGSALVAAAIFFKDYGATPAQPAQVPSVLPGAPSAPTVLSDVKAARETERHLYGAADAPITIVEFSDFECPFCARLHPTLKRIVDESNGRVNWEYRHLPLPNHQNARSAAIASECVAKLVGADAFWKYSDVLFANIGKATPAFQKTEAGKLGVNASAFDSCIADTTIAARVEEDAATANRLGGSGTPFNIVIDNETREGRPVNGAVPYEQWQVVLNSL